MSIPLLLLLPLLLLAAVAAIPVATAGDVCSSLLLLLFCRRPCGQNSAACLRWVDPNGSAPRRTLAQRGGYDRPWSPWRSGTLQICWLDCCLFPFSTRSCFPFSGPSSAHFLGRMKALWLPKQGNVSQTTGGMLHCELVLELQSVTIAYPSSIDLPQIFLP